MPRQNLLLEVYLKSTHLRLVSNTKSYQLSQQLIFNHASERAFPIVLQAEAQFD
jgi:hypothetical protein